MVRSHAALPRQARRRRISPCLMWLRQRNHRIAQAQQTLHVEHIELLGGCTGVEAIITGDRQCLYARYSTINLTPRLVAGHTSQTCSASLSGALSRLHRLTDLFVSHRELSNAVFGQTQNSTKLVCAQPS